jgi:hypothetical protein
MRAFRAKSGLRAFRSAVIDPLLIPAFEIPAFGRRVAREFTQSSCGRHWVVTRRG